MKPTTKLQVRIMKLSMKLPKVNQNHYKWAEKLHDKFVTKSYSKMYCLECNHSWKYDLQDWTAKIIDHSCPNCKAKLKPIENAPSFTEFRMFSIVTTVQEFQVIRYFTVWKHMWKNDVPKYWIIETFQEWDAHGEKPRTTVVGFAKNGYGYYGRGDGFQYSSNFDIKDGYSGYGGYKYNIHPDAVYPRARVLPQIKRNGFAGKFHECSPRELFDKIVSSPIAETLLKAKESDMLLYFVHKREQEINMYWNQIKLCMKHKYKITDFSLWADYISFLSYLGKDINNPIFICPKDLHAAHNEYMLKKQVIVDRLKEEEETEKAEIESMAKALKQKYFKNFTFSDDMICVQVLLKQSEFKEEGQKLRHCVGGYYNKKDSLVMSARINGEPIETIEISLSKLQILQARGLQNKATEHHARIVSLVEKNMPKIKQLINKQKADSKLKKKTVKTKLLCQTA